MISIIIPVLNEELTISSVLNHVFGLSGNFEVIVVDGGSQDNTLKILKSYDQVKIITGPQGRAVQMNAGAEHAQGEMLLFLHADTILPDSALTTINGFEEENDIQAGGFLHQFSGQDWRLKLISKIDNYRCRKSKIFYGDQALFVRNSMFKKIGGFPDQTILEDWAFGQMLRQHTNPVIIKDKVITDSRKFEKAGIWKSFLRVAAILTRLKLGLPVPEQHPFFENVR